MEELLKIVTINHNNEDNEIVEIVLDQQFFYRICDINISIDNTGYVYMLISIRRRYFVCIIKTNENNKWLRAHNSGIGYQTSQQVNLRPYSIFTYICGSMEIEVFCTTLNINGNITWDV